MKRRRLAIKMIFSTIFTLLVAGGVWAQSSAPKGNAKNGTRTQSINFEDELIQGNIQKPNLFYLMQRRDFNFKRLIELRNNFLPEMNQTAQDIGRSQKPGG